MPQNAAGQFVVPIRQSGINVTGVGMNSSRDITGVQVVQLPQRNNGNIPLARRLVNMEEDGVPPSLIYRVQPVD